MAAQCFNGRALAGAAMLALAAPFSAAAQTPPTDFEDRIDPAAPSAATARPEARKGLPRVSAEIAADSVPLVPIAQIRFVGAEAPREVAEAARPFIGRTASLEALQALTAAMSAAYERSPIAFFTIIIPAQDFSGGVVRVMIAEGFVEAVILTGDVEGRKLDLVKAYADRLTTERPTRRATLERYLSLINDIPGLKAKTKLQKGAQAGAVRLYIDLDYKRPTVAAGFSNRTSQFVDDGQFSAEAKAYRLLREGDETRLNLAAAVNFKDNLYAGVQHSTPLLRDGARLNVAFAWLKSQPAGTPVVGDAQIYSAGVSVPVIRSYRSNLTLKVSIDVLNSDNAAFGSLIATERTRAARLSASYRRATKRRSVAATAGASQGLAVLGARITQPAGELDFTKLSANAVVRQRVGGRGSLRFNAAGQWTKDALPANERFSIGGANFGRAFENGLVSADRGFALLAETAWRPVAGGPFAKSEAYAFADYARGRIFPRNAAAGGTPDLGSYGAGLRAAFKDNGMIELEAARPYDVPTPDYDPDWRLFVRWRVRVRP